MSLRRLFYAGLACFLCCAAARGGVIVTQNVSPSATNWSGSPFVTTLSDLPSASVAESFNGGNGNTNIGQLFTIPPANYTLQKICIYVSGGTGTAQGTNLTLRLYDLGVQSAYPVSYAPSIIGGNLFGGGSGLEITLAPQTGGILQLDFTGPDQVVLLGDHTYAFELDGIAATTPIFWQRRPSFPTGAAYRNQTFLSGDFALAVYSVESANVVLPGRATANWNDVRQRIDGFGASSAWRSTMSATVANRYFSTNTGIGLSLLRTRIAPGGTTVENNIMQLARDRGARIWSAPWSPSPVEQFKSIPTLNGGNFVGNPVNYAAYAGQLARYVVNMKNQYGITLYALSIQNEPDANVTTYEACRWTSQQIHDFAPYLAAALAASNVASTKIMLPESQNWTDPGGLRNATMNDPTTTSLVSIIANHNYVPNNNIGDQATPVALNTGGKALWQTEVSTFNAYDPGMTNGIYWAKRLHAFLTVAQVNAWHYWWLNASDNSGLASSTDVLAKRAYVLGQFSRFVRPDYYRLGVVTNQGAALVSAYKSFTSARFAIVAINPTNYFISQTVALTGFNASSVTPWITTASQSLANQAAIGITNSAITYLLPPMSVVTFVGQSSNNAAPVLATVSNQTVNAGVTLVVTNTAADIDLVLGQTLTFSLLSGTPTNAVINPTNGIFKWRPSIQQAGTTNVVIAKVSDNGSPSLSATNSFIVRVNPLVSPAISAIASTGTGHLLSISGPLGPDYTLLTSSNLSDWQILFTTNAPPVPFVFDDGNADVARFYRIQLGP